MKQLRFFTLSVLVLALGLVVGGGPASAAIYQDNFTAKILGVQTVGNGPYNPYGLSLNQEFSWHIQYETPIIGGTIMFDASHPNNQLYLPIPRSGLSPLILTQANDDYYPDWPLGEYSGGQLQSLQYNVGWVKEVFPSPYSGWLSLDFNAGLMYFDATDGGSSKITLNFGLGSFNPDTDRQVVPIPGALVLLGSGLAALTILRRRQG